MRPSTASARRSVAYSAGISAGARHRARQHAAVHGLQLLAHPASRSPGARRRAAVALHSTTSTPSMSSTSACASGVDCAEVARRVVGAGLSTSHQQQRQAAAPGRGRAARRGRRARAGSSWRGETSERSSADGAAVARRLDALLRQQHDADDAGAALEGAHGDLFELAAMEQQRRAEDVVAADHRQQRGRSRRPPRRPPPSARRRGCCAAARAQFGARARHAARSAGAGAPSYPAAVPRLTTRPASSSTSMLPPSSCATDWHSVGQRRAARQQRGDLLVRVDGGLDVAQVPLEFGARLVGLARARRWRARSRARSSAPPRRRWPACTGSTCSAPCACGGSGRRRTAGRSPRRPRSAARRPARRCLPRETCRRASGRARSGVSCR